MVELEFDNPLGDADASDDKEKDGGGSSTPVRAVRAAQRARTVFRCVLSCQQSLRSTAPEIRCFIHQETITTMMTRSLLGWPVVARKPERNRYALLG